VMATTNFQKLLLLLGILLVATNAKNFRGNDDSTTTTPPSKIHPFDILPNKMTELNWDPVRIDEFVRNHWETDKTFLGKPKNDRPPTLSTSCLHTAAWIVQGLLELQTRPNVYVGLWRRTPDENLVVYDNTHNPAERTPGPAIQAMKNFINSRPADEDIVLQVDMYQIRPTPSPTYVDHHFAMHVYDGQVNVYHNWVGVFNLIDWMSKPETHKMRYPMPIDTWFDLLEKALTYTEDEEANRVRYEAIWKLFGITDTFVFGEKKDMDPIVSRLSYPWLMSYITHWPSPPKSNE